MPDYSHNPERRRLLAIGAMLGAGGLITASYPTALWALKDIAQRRDWYFSAADGEDGSHHLAGIRHDGSEHFLLPVSERCHGGCLRPHQPQAVLFARRPGRHFHVIDARQHTPLASIDAGKGYHFYGHGVFDPSGRWLYVTANRLSDSMGLVRVYDAEANYAHCEDFSLDGIGPHELVLMPDGETLAVALGGIKTHPDSGRIKLNLSDMAPALLMMDRRGGEITARHQPSHHQLSCRHLDVAADGSLVAGYQFQGPVWETGHPLLAHLTPQGKFEEIALPAALQSKLGQYTASIAMSQRQPITLVTAPRGGCVVLLDHTSGDVIASPALDDAAGARCDGNGGFIVTTGNGGVYQLSGNGELAEVSRLAVRWDNHLA